MKKLFFYLAAYVGFFTQTITGQISVKIDKPMSEADHAEVKNLMASVPNNTYSFKSDVRGKNGNVRKEMGGLQGLNNVQGLMNAMPRTAFEGGANRGGQRGNTMNNGQNRGQSSGSYQPNPGGNQRGMGTNPRSGGVQDPFNSGNQNQNNNQRPNTDIRGNAENSGSMAGNRPGSMVNRSGMAQGKEGEKPESGGGKPDGGGGKPDGGGGKPDGGGKAPDGDKKPGGGATAGGESKPPVRGGSDKPPTKPEKKPGEKPDKKPGGMDNKPDKKPGDKPEKKPGEKPDKKPDRGGGNPEGGESGGNFIEYGTGGNTVDYGSGSEINRGEGGNTYTPTYWRDEMTGNFVINPGFNNLMPTSLNQSIGGSYFVCKDCTPAGMGTANFEKLSGILSKYKN